MAKIEHIHGSIVRVDGQEIDLRYLKARIQRLTGMMEHMQKEYQGLKRKRKNAINTLTIIMEAIDGEVIDGERASYRAFSATIWSFIRNGTAFPSSWHTSVVRSLSAIQRPLAVSRSFCHFLASFAFVLTAPFRGGIIKHFPGRGQKERPMYAICAD